MSLVGQSNKKGGKRKGAPAAPVSPFAAFSVPVTHSVPSGHQFSAQFRFCFASLQFQSQHSSRYIKYNFTIRLRKHVVHNTQRTPER